MIGQLTGGTTGFILVILIFIVLILWVFLPFVVFGLKPILRSIEEKNAELVKELRIANELSERRAKDADPPG